MATLNRDKNHKTIAGAVNSVDNITALPFKVDPSTNALLIEVVSGGETPTVMTQDKRDPNFVPTYYGISDVDGVTLVPIRTDANGALLIE
jgi:hypothetical protein